MTENLPPELARKVKREEHAEIFNPVETEKNEHNLRETMHRRNVGTTYMHTQQHAEDRG